MKKKRINYTGIVKPILILFCCICLSSNLYSQSLMNGNFQTYNGCAQAYDQFLHCVPYWEASHGTPQIEQETIYTIMGGGVINYYALITGGWNGDQSEGIRTNNSIQFKQGQKYRLSYRIRSTSNRTKVFYTIMLGTGVRLRNSSFPGGSGTEEVPSASSTQKIIDRDYYGGAITPGTGWQSVTRDFIALNDYECLWIYADGNQKDGDQFVGTAHIQVDDISIITCDQNQLYQNTNNLPDVTNVIDYIKAGNYVNTSQPAGNVSILSGFYKRFFSGNFISLESGFEVIEGAYFDGVIMPCQDPFKLKQSTDQEYDNLLQNSRVSNTPIGKDISVYPNPSTGQITCEFIVPVVTKVEIELFNSLGLKEKDLFKTNKLNIGNHEKSFNLSDLKPGIYGLKFNIDDVVTFKKIVISN